MDANEAKLMLLAMAEEMRRRNAALPAHEDGPHAAAQEMPIVIITIEDPWKE